MQVFNSQPGSVKVPGFGKNCWGPLLENTFMEKHHNKRLLLLRTGVLATFLADVDRFSVRGGLEQCPRGKGYRLELSFKRTR